MSSTGMWIVGAIPDSATVAMADHFHDVFTGHQPEKPDSYAASLAWWQAGGDELPFFEDAADDTLRRPTDAALRFAELVHHANPDTDRADDLRDTCLDLMNDDDPNSVSIVTARKASPVAALYYGLGAAGSSLLPGRFGDFLLAHDAVTAALPGIERALALTGARRTEVSDRITAWITAMGDDPTFDAQQLIDGPLHVLRHAAAGGHGIAAFTRWY